MFTTRAVSAHDKEALARLFEAACSNCFCRYWHFDGDKNDWLMRLAASPEENRSELERALDDGSDDARGIVALNDANEVIGWLKLARASSTPKILDQRYYRGLSCLAGDRGGWFVIGCALVRPDARHLGVTIAMVREAVVVARSLGGVALFGLPRVASEPVSNEELWMGPYRAFIDAGFREVHSERPYPVMRFDLGTRE